MKKYFTSKPEELQPRWPGDFFGIESSWHEAVHKLTPGDPSLVVVALKTVGISVDDKYYNEKDKKEWLEWIGQH